MSSSGDFGTTSSPTAPREAAAASPTTNNGDSPPSRWWVVFVATGFLLVLAGGFVAAAGGAAPSRRLAWTSAYLVLVCGSAQVCLGGGQALVTTRRPPPGLCAAELATFNLGNAAVLAGTLTTTMPVLDTGSAILVTALGLFALATRRTQARRRLITVAYRTTVAVLAISIPVGGLLAR